MSVKEFLSNLPPVPNKEVLLKLPSLSDEEAEKVAECVIRKIKQYFPILTSGLYKEVETPIKMRDVCRLLQISDTTARTWMSNGSLPFHRKGNRVYFFKSEVLKSLEQPLKRKA